MLGTRERTLFLDSLRPPAGYRLRRGVGTSFTLDLMALLTAPLAFTFFDAHDDDGAPITDPVLLLEALRRHAEKITLFCQAGAIGVPRPGQGLLAFLERSVVEVQARHEGGIFHPKIWVLAFEADDKPAIYRVLCLSRNLTFARAWDTCLRLEGKITEGQGDYARNEPFAELLLALPRLSTRPISPESLEELERMANEVRMVNFHLPWPFTDFRVHNFGLGERREWPFPTGGRSLVVSPFLVGSTVQDLKRNHGLDVLISRPEAFEDVVRAGGPKALPKTCYVLSSGADLDSRDAENEREEGSEGSLSDEDEIELVGLHAKLFLFEQGWDAQLFTGSANATGAAFRQNVEVLVELVGKKSRCGIDVLLGLEDDPKLATIRSILQEYRVPDTIEPTDDSNEELERSADRWARRLGAARLTATACEVEDGGRWDMMLSGALPEIPAGTDVVEVRVWPATLPAEAALRISGAADQRREPLDATEPTDRAEPADHLVTFKRLSFEALTAFFAFEVTLGDGQHTVRKRFAVTAELLGAPEDRKERLLHSLLEDRSRVLQLLFLILRGEGADVSGFVEPALGDGSAQWGSFGGWDQTALLEALLRSLSHDPRRIDDARRLIADLERTPEGRKLLPEDLSEIWEPVWAARKALKS
ncbi:phospholipase D family protein [Candidatus Palauibacter sp.]|uniref:phospholipase D family protein n=1 Tax=Candidatus Palauibacter sp. TaxID=3101350 RepID=UPI003D11DC91